MPQHDHHEGDPVRLSTEGEERYPNRRGQRGVIVTLSKAAPNLVAVRWEGVSTVDYCGARYLESDK